MSAPTSQTTESAFLKKAWFFTIAYTLFVILFGAVVRITGSGAGCGQHWPTCHGEVAHLPQTVETLIEQTHRLTSGLSMVLLFVVAYLTFRAFEKGHGARRAAFLSCVFMITEALVGAGLVLLELVGANDSVPRAAVMAVHLVNTSALMFFMLAALWSVSHPQHKSWGLRPFEKAQAWCTAGALLLVVVSAAGAVTALGDTLYPVAEGMSSLQVGAEFTESSSHFLQRLRGVHPILASLAAVYFLSLAPRFRQRAGTWVVWITVLQVILGLSNIYLSAPGWMQVLHLAVANALWIVWLWAWFSYAYVLKSKQEGGAGV